MQVRDSSSAFEHLTIKKTVSGDRRNSKDQEAWQAPIAVWKQYRLICHFPEIWHRFNLLNIKSYGETLIHCLPASNKLLYFISNQCWNFCNTFPTVTFDCVCNSSVNEPFQLVWEMILFVLYMNEIWQCWRDGKWTWVSHYSRNVFCKTYASVLNSFRHNLHVQRVWTK
jgi:hypothetical protein